MGGNNTSLPESVVKGSATGFGSSCPECRGINCHVVGCQIAADEAEASDTADEEAAEVIAVSEGAENSFRTRAQAAKAARIARYLLTIYSPDEAVPALEQLTDDDLWQDLAHDAGVNADKAPSPTTRAMVLGILDTPLPRLKLPEVSR